MSAQVRYLLLLAGWAIVSFVPNYAGNWWDQHFQVYQALTSLMVIGMAHSLFKRLWWVEDLAVVCMLQIVHCLGDYLFFHESPQIYNYIQAGLNYVEVLFLIWGGAGVLLYGRFAAVYDAPPRGDTDRRNKRVSHA